MSTNKYFDHLLNLGYAMHIYQSSYLDFCSTPGITVVSCSSYESNSIGTVSDIDIAPLEKSRFIMNSYLDSSGFLRFVRHNYVRAGQKLGIPLPSWRSGNSRTGPLAVMPTLESLKDALRNLNPGEAHFAHLMLPHYPYNLHADCTVKPRVGTWLNIAPFSVEGQLGEQNTASSRKERYRQYVLQMECTQSIIEELFSAIKASGHWQQTIIIIQGDHGSRIVRHIPRASNLEELVATDFRDAYSAFFAVKNGDSEGQLDSTLIPLQALLATVWKLPIPSIEPKQVYVRSAGISELLAIPLQGFEE